ncbi:MAG: VTT domain-containing protein [Myxococcales bacterium]|nr:VTT domain-containing protein [Myxococcales bacterium]
MTDAPTATSASATAGDERELQELLCALTVVELRQVISVHVDEEDAAALPGDDDLDALARAVLETLTRTDAIDRTLFVTLQELKPTRARDIKALATRWSARSQSISPQRIILNLVLGMMAFTLIIAAIGFWLAEPLRAVAALFVAHLGATGVMLGFFFPDGFTIPLPPDAFSALGLAGGLGFWTVVLWSSVGSVLGGATGFTIGRRLSKTRWFRRKINKGNGAAVHELIERFGALGLAIAASTPLPYSIGTWAAGTTRMTYTQFFLISIPLRSVRVAFMLWLVELGLKAGGS